MKRIAAGLVLLLCACSGNGSAPEPAAGETTAAPEAPPADVYIVRGEVERLPGADDPARGFYVHHEAIDDFKASDGTVLGMDAMVMQFPLRDASLLEGIAVGDKVELTYEVNWHATPQQNVSSIAKLPAETELVYRAAQPPDEGE